MKIVNTLAQIAQLPLGTKLYRPTATNVRWWYFAGINPLSDKSIMLISAGNIQEIHGEYIADREVSPFYLDYKEACAVLLENAKKNVETVKKIFIDKN